jgi:hypothetical protein
LYDTIRPYITKDEPFGPIDSVDIDPKDTDVMNRLFERHNWIYKNLHQRPSIIMGRKGAGKTYYLRIPGDTFRAVGNHLMDLRAGRDP